MTTEERLAKAIWEASNLDNCSWEGLIAPENEAEDRAEFYRQLARDVLDRINAVERAAR